MLIEDDILPKSMHVFWKMAKGSVLYVSGKKPGSWPKGCMGQVV